ncbi:L-rhamnose mutarotase [Mucilaginibacter pedocola]|uniref:L-rhamnose mutarotase n=1 Tax=Mucilaginibacter pedocola TaxID=1792845 RepID=A0A1S9PCW8_9SPHI|nr:L-rhamnose mutarotase [Mucilaginibacter pedocola]OOQ58779.1 L-rhamnose mutarotase [Mucilaginibacter pedocola]
MKRIAFKMALLPGCEAEYEKRHNEIWPQLVAELKTAGISDYSIFLDSETNSLFGVLKLTDEKALEALPTKEIMQQWWAYMGDIMQTNDDGSPRSLPLKEVFYLP